MFKKLLVFTILIMTIFTGCSKYDTVKEGDDNYPIISPFPDKTDKEIILYYRDIEYDYLITELRKVKVEEGKKIEEVVMQEFLKGPRTNTARNLVPKGAELLSIDIVEGTAYVNFNNKLITENISEENEALLLYSIVNTVSELKDVVDVQILIEGKNRRIFCRHYRIDKPLQGNRFLVNRNYVSPVETIIGFYDGLKNRDHGLAMQYIKILTEQNINNPLLERHLESKYQNIFDYKINNYVIEKYDTNLNIEVDISIYFFNERKPQKFKELYNLVFERNKFIIMKKLE